MAVYINDDIGHQRERTERKRVKVLEYEYGEEGNVDT